MTKEITKTFIVKTNFEEIKNVHDKIKNEFDKLFENIVVHNLISKENLEKILSDNISYSESGQGEFIQVILNIYKTDNNPLIGIIMFTNITNLFKN